MENLELGFAKTKLHSSEGMILLGQAVSHMQKLQKLSVVIYRTNLEDEGLIALGRALKGKIKLAELFLSFGKTKLLSDDVLITLGESLKTLTALKHFELYVQKTKITDLGFKKLAISLQEHWKLEKLTLNFGDTDI